MCSGNIEGYAIRRFRLVISCWKSGIAKSLMHRKSYIIVYLLFLFEVNIMY